MKDLNINKILLIVVVVVILVVVMKEYGKYSEQARNSELLRQQQAQQYLQQGEASTSGTGGLGLFDLIKFNPIIMGSKLWTKVPIIGGWLGKLGF